MEIKELYENMKFEEIIENYQSSNRYDHILYCLSSFISLERIAEAYEFYKSKETIIEKTNFLASMNYLLLILAILDNKYLINHEFERIRNLPYQNQTVEEFINSLDENFNKFKAQTKKSDEKNINYVDDLNSKNVEDVIKAIDYIHKNYSDKFSSFGVLFYEAFINRKEFDQAKSLLLINLFLTGFDKDISFIKNNKFYFLNPKDYQIKYRLYEARVNRLILRFKREEKNINLINDIIDIFFEKILDYLPDFYQIDELDSLLYISIKEIYKICLIKIEEDQFIETLSLNKEFIEKYLKNS